MDKWALRGHFYSYVDPVRSLYNIGPCCHVIAHVVFLVELPVQRRLYLIFVKSWVLKKKRGLNGVVFGYPTSMNLLWVDGLSTDPWDLGRYRFGKSSLRPNRVWAGNGKKKLQSGR